MHLSALSSLQPIRFLLRQLPDLLHRSCWCCPCVPVPLWVCAGQMAVVRKIWVKLGATDRERLFHLQVHSWHTPHAPDAGPTPAHRLPLSVAVGVLLGH